jgi:ubiquinone/menaquinone biosynthesis C-methylase UbiE
MGFYRNVVLPKLCDLSMRNKWLWPYRERVIGAAEGRVLEIGAGSGLNLQLYRSGAKEAAALEPDPRLLRMAERNAKHVLRPVMILEASAEQIPLDDGSVDTVVTTWTLCTIPDAVRALREARRVLKATGKLLFIEHGLAPERNVQRWQDGLTPVWTKISSGCHLNRPIAQIIETGGYAIERLETGYLPGPKFLAYLSEGSARPI